MLHLAGGEGLRVDIADLLEFQAALQRNGVVKAAADEEGVLGVGIFAGKTTGCAPLSASVFSIFSGRASSSATSCSYWPSASVPRTRQTQ